VPPPPPPPPLDNLAFDDLAGARALPAPRYPSFPDPAERSSDFVAEAVRLGDEAQRAADAAHRARAMAAAAARAAALATEASSLASMGDHHEAIQRLREAQLVEDALKRGEVPHGLGEGEELFTSEQAPLSVARARSREGTGGYRALRTRENVTVAVIVAVGLLVIALFAVLLFRF
jgi:hypothetical protein